MGSIARKGEFAILLVQAKAQHGMLEPWQKEHSGEFNKKARGSSS